MKEKKEKKPAKNTNKEKFGTKFVNTIKKKWLISGTNTLLLIAILVAIVILINSAVQSLDLTPIDCTSNKEYTLTNESKDRVKNINSDVNIYFVGYEDSATQVNLAKQYNKANSKLNVEVIDTNERTDIASKYNVTNDSKAIIIENGEKSKTLYSDDLYTYDSSYQTIDLTEEKITSAILNVTSEKIANVYFLSGYSDYSLEYSGGMYYLASYLKDEVLNYQTLDILVKGSIPEDCDTLVITTPKKDFDELTTNEITKYINNGGKILWLNASYSEQKDLPNVNKILATYGINPFEVGAIRETDTSKMVSQSPDLIIPEIQYSDVTKKLYNSTGVIFLNATKINVVGSEELSNLKVTKTDLIKTSENSYFRSNFKIQSNEPQDGEEKQAYLVGAELEKTITEANSENGTEEVKSKLIIYGENYFASDAQLSQSSQTPIIAYRQNKDLALNSIAYLSDREEDITVRKGTGTVKYTATEQESRIILGIITAVPLLIILIGIIVWVSRKRKK